MNYIARQVQSSQDVFSSCWSQIAKYDSPLQGSVLVPITEQSTERNSRGAWLLDTDAKIDMLAHLSGVGVFGIAARVLRLKDAFRPYNTITFRFNKESNQGELQSILLRLNSGCLTPSFIVSVQISEAKGIRHVGIVNTRRLARAVMKRQDSATVCDSSSGVSFYSINLETLPHGAAWSFPAGEVQPTPSGTCCLDLMKAAA